MTVEQVEEQTDTEIEKEAREYSQEYIQELRDAAKEYLPKAVWDHLHRTARSKAGGRASGKARTAASAAAQSSEATTAQAVSQPPEVEAQLQEARTMKEDDVEKQEEIGRASCRERVCLYV